MTEKEKQILSFMEHLGIDRAEAEALYEDDEEDFIGEEGEEMQRNAKQIKRYEQSDKPRKKTTRERKVDTEKKALLEMLMNALTENKIEIVSTKNEAEFSFLHSGNNYSVKLIKHRPPKK